MKKITKEPDDWGQDVIYVQKCDKYEYEDQEIPKKSFSSIHNSEISKIDDIMYAVENYFYNSGE